MRKLLLLFLVFFWGALVAVHGVEPDGPLPFTISKYTVEPVTVELSMPPYVTEYEKAYEVGYTVSNSSDKTLRCDLLFYSSDTICPLDESDKPAAKIVRPVDVPANGVVKGVFRYWAGQATYSGVHYPLHVKAEFTFEGRKLICHAARVIETNLPAKLKPVTRTVIKQGGISLMEKSFAAFFQFDEQKPVFIANNMSGRCEKSYATCTRSTISVDGQTERVFSMHPPYRPKGGKLFLEYPISLPKTKGLTFAYSGAKGSSKEVVEKSNGVQYRVWIREADGKRILLDTLDAQSPSWTSHQCSLDRWSGQEVDLIVELNPGPKNDTNCDSCLLGGLLINTRAGQVLSANKTTGRRYTFNLKDGMRAIVKPGPLGLLDADFFLGSAKKNVTFKGMRIAVDGFLLNDPNAKYIEEPKVDFQNGVLTYRYSLLHNDEISNVTLRVYNRAGMLIIDVPKENPVTIGALSMGPTDQKVDRLYFGHGYVVEKPEKNVISGGGHGLSTSHIGMDYENGLSILQGSSMPPDALIIDPENRICTLRISDATSLALLPSENGAFDAAKKYRLTVPWLGQPGPGTARKAGRLVFDVWGGTAKELTETMKKVFEYGVTDSLFLQHVTQRWGYDIKLPDIWEPDSMSGHVINPRAGSVEDLRDFNLLCKKYGVPFGIHDNYIDLYPDAADFSYKYVYFGKSGQPVKAWLNPHRARSYKWRPDLFKPFLERNMKIANRYMPEMDAYFVDVFASTGIEAVYGQDGSFIPRHVVQNCWKDAFETIGQYLSQKKPDGKKEPGITVSEAGSDFLIGSLDGSDAQWLELAPDYERYSMRCPCLDWERTPWFAAVNHSNYIRHGAGYSGRYEKNRARTFHGICSDDYICSELLGGLCLMTDYRSLYPQSIRKHFWAQHIVRDLANEQIESVRFENGKDGKPTIHRQLVTWTNGYKIWVNRSPDDWKVNDNLLPEYGWVVYDKSGKFLAGLVRDPKHLDSIVELSQRPDSFYVNGRGYRMSASFKITPKFVKMNDLGNGKFQIFVDWLAEEGLPVDASVFVHIFSEEDGFIKKGWYAGGEVPNVPTTRWGEKSASSDTTRIETGRGQTLTVPSNLPDGTYHLLVGLFDSRGTGGRFTLALDSLAGSDRYTIGLLTVRRENGKVLLSVDQKVPVDTKNNPRTIARYRGNREAVAFRGVETRGAVSVTPDEKLWKILPIPMMPDFEVVLDEAVIGKTINAITLKGKSVDFKRTDRKVVFAVKAENANVYDVTFN